jgi:hypothetical protein
MSRYGFTLNFCMDFLKCKIHNLQIKQFFFNQLKNMAVKISKDPEIRKLHAPNEMEIVSNTHENSKTFRKNSIYPQKVLTGRKRISWVDEEAPKGSPNKNGLMEIIQCLELKKHNEIRKKDYLPKFHNLHKAKKGVLKANLKAQSANFENLLNSNQRGSTHNAHIAPHLANGNLLGIEVGAKVESKAKSQPSIPDNGSSHRGGGSGANGNILLNSGMGDSGKDGSVGGNGSKGNTREGSKRDDYDMLNDIKIKPIE